MPLRRPPAAAFCLGAVAAACSTPPVPWPAATELLAEAPDTVPARLAVDRAGVHTVAIALGPGGLPDPVRTTVEAVAPHGELRFQGREWGPRGDGYRVEKHYREGTAEHTRSVLVAADGGVLERWHTVPLPQAPAPVLQAAMQVGPEVLEAAIVSGPLREEYWLATVRDRLGRTLVVTIGLDGRVRGQVRRLAARIDG